MYNANNMHKVADEARQKKEILKKCVAQQFFAKIYPAIEEAAANGEFSIIISIPRDCGFAVREISKLFQKFEYGWKVEKQNWFSMFVKISW